MNSKSDPILIVGGGLGGLATALAFGRKGRRVRVFEQTREFGAIGYGIQLGPNVFHMFDRLGVSDAVKRDADVPPASVWFDAYSGREVTRVETGPEFEARFKHPYIIIHRVDLHHVLLNACRAIPSIEFAPAAMVTGFEDHGDHVIVSTADGERVRGAMVIGADGLRSRIRAQLLNDGEPRLMGWVAHRTTVPMDQVPDGVARDVVALWGGEGFHIVHYPLRHGRLFNLVAVFRTSTYDQRGNAASHKAEVLRTYAHAHPIMQALIGITDFDWRGAIADRDPIRHWSRGRVVLLGDAAHPTLQSLAQGACMAIEDGVCLAELVHLAGDDVPAAFHAFEVDRVMRTTQVIYESRSIWRDYHAEGPSREVVLDSYRALSREQVWDAVAWLYDGHEVPTRLKPSPNQARSS